MIEREAFAAGMKLLSTAFREPLTPELTEVYYAVLGNLEPEQWAAAVGAALKRNSPFMPRPGEMLAPFQQQERSRDDGEAAAAFERITSGEFMDYKLEGSVFNVGRLRVELGAQAHRAFMAAGGPGAFAYVAAQNRPFMLKAFREEWAACAQEQRLQLPAGSTETRALTDGRAVCGQSRAATHGPLGAPLLSPCVKDRDHEGPCRDRDGGIIRAPQNLIAPGGAR